MGNLISVEEVKIILQISGSAHDVFIDTMIPLAEEFVLDYCNISFEQAATHIPLKVSLANMIDYQLGKPSNITSEKIGNYSVTYGSTLYPQHIVAGLRPYRKATFISGSAGYGVHSSTFNTFIDASNV